jgi:hypothetical protein
MRSLRGLGEGSERFRDHKAARTIDHFQARTLSSLVVALSSSPAAKKESVSRPFDPSASAHPLHLS